MKSISTHRRKTLSIVVLSLFISLVVSAQEKDSEMLFEKYEFVNITEIGGMFGRVKNFYNYYPYYSSYYPPRQYNEDFEVRNVADITLQTFNGVYLNPKTAVGITTGVDWFNTTLIVPIQIGVRRQIVQKKEGGAAIIAGLDTGYGTTILHEDNSDTKTSGGFTISPTIGYKIPNRGGSAWVLNFGYKHQTLSLKNIQNIDEYYSSVETRNYNRLVVRFGFEF